MDDLVVRAMTAREFDVFRSDLVSAYAAEHVQAGDWRRDEAESRAVNRIDALLPEGVETQGMLLLTAASTGDDVVGKVWVCLERPDGGGAWVHDIEVDPQQRGRGYGRALMQVAEEEAARRGVGVIGLNVFGANAVARSLYDSLGYETTSLQMRKKLTGDPD